MTHKPRVYIDVSPSILNGLSTGIQRIVFNFAKNLVNENHFHESMLFIPVLVSRKTFGKLRIEIVDIDKWQLMGSSRTNRLVPIEKIVKGAFIFLRNMPFIRTWLANVYCSVKRLRLKRSGILSRKILSIHQNDILFESDSFWHFPSSLSLIERFQSINAKVFLFIHDLLPIDFPEYFRNSDSKRFKKSFQKLNSSKINFITSSEYVSKRICFHFDKNAKIIPIGIEKKKISSKTAFPSCILMIGTIEPRKNHATVLKWYLESDENRPLVIVGRRGWKSKQIVKKINLLISKKRGLVWIQDCDDECLENIFASATLGICASYAEGYGLPLREFLIRNIKTVASNIPPFLEILPTHKEFVTYFEPYNVESLTNAIKQSEKSRANYTNELSFPSWRETVTRLIEIFEDQTTKPKF